MTNDFDEQIAALEKSDNLPRHIAIIMDGNGRWAKKRRLPRLAGHQAGREPVRVAIRTCARIGIPYLSLYTFSLENWARPRAEVAGLMRFLEEVLKREYLELNENGVQLRVIGRTDMLPDSTRKVLDATIAKLANNSRLVLTLAVSYGGRAEIVDAVQKILAHDPPLAPESIDEETFRNFLYDGSVPDPDLLIRTSGEMRVSNFMLWQIAYSEIHVTDVLWPDFTQQQLIDGIRAYQARDRRYGL
ncbi:MAG: isoprenyl transferase [Candidatus Krumholzibacteriota bacterium]|nr:isoprenyl transferase [Candidatus Krumholzibacteriota bacterium]